MSKANVIKSYIDDISRLNGELEGTNRGLRNELDALRAAVADKDAEIEMLKRLIPSFDPSLELSGNSGKLAEPECTCSTFERAGITFCMVCDPTCPRCHPGKATCDRCGSSGTLNHGLCVKCAKLALLELSPTTPTTIRTTTLAKGETWTRRDWLLDYDNTYLICFYADLAADFNGRK